MRALTFDLWDTLVVDDSDEVRRRALGLPSKAQARTDGVVASLARHGVARKAAEGALEAANAWCAEAWRSQWVNPTLQARLERVYEVAGATPGPEFPALVDAFATMEVVHPPEPAPGVHEALELLSSRYPLAIVSDAVVTPGRELRRILQQHGLLHYFRVCVFSDEAGRSKPAPEVFHLAAAGLGLPTEALVHVGDRVDKDVAGAEAVGAQAVLYTGVRHRGAEHRWMVDDLRALPALLESL